MKRLDLLQAHSHIVASTQIVRRTRSVTADRQEPKVLTLLQPGFVFSQNSKSNQVTSPTQ